MSLPALLLSLALGADDGLSLEAQAQLDRDLEKASSEVSKKYEGKKSSELSQDERRQMIKDQAEAQKKVFEKAGVDPKQYEREQLKRGRDDYAKQKDMVKALAEKDKAAAEALKKATEKMKEKEVQVQRGISDENPVTIDEKENEDGTVTVEKGSLDADADQAAAKEQDLLENMGPASDGPSKPSKSSKGKGGRRR